MMSTGEPSGRGVAWLFRLHFKRAQGVAGLARLPLVVLRRELVMLQLLLILSHGSCASVSFCVSVFTVFLCPVVSLSLVVLPCWYALRDLNFSESCSSLHSQYPAARNDWWNSYWAKCCYWRHGKFVFRHYKSWRRNWSASWLNSYHQKLGAWVSKEGKFWSSD